MHFHRDLADEHELVSMCSLQPLRKHKLVNVFIDDFAVSKRDEPPLVALK